MLESWIEIESKKTLVCRSQTGTRITEMLDISKWDSQDVEGG